MAGPRVSFIPLRYVIVLDYSIHTYSEEERLECVRDRQVREWLSVTFTRVDSVYENHPVSVTPIVRFKAAANTIIISHYLGK